MEYDRRQALAPDTALEILEESSGNRWTAVIGREIGRGGSCLVYSGFQRGFVGAETVSRPVIIKEFYPKALDGVLCRNADGSLSCPEEHRPAFDKRLAAFCAGQASHILFASEHAARALPPLFASGRANGTFYALSAPGEGVSMDRADREGMTLQDALALIISVSDAIHAVHQNGMRLYLDLKPANIYVEDGRALLFDFDTVQPRERLRYCSCSPGWSAPEQALADDRTGYADARKIGFHTDVYAIAAVFFYLLTGRKPSPADLEEIRKGAAWKALVTLRDPSGALDSPAFTAELDRVMRSALQTDPDKRALDYGGATAALKIRNDFAALSAIAAQVPNRRQFEKTRAAVEKTGEAVDAARSSIEKTVRRYSLKHFLFGSRKRVLLTAAAVILLAAVAGAAAGLIGSLTRGAPPAAVYREDVTDRHLLLALENGSHSYEVGLENWRRLDYARAERAFLEARQELSSQVSQGHPEMARLNNSLGCLYLDMGKYEQAYDCLNSAYVVFRGRQGETAPETMAVLFSVAQYDYLTGDPDSALRTLGRILDRADVRAHPGAAACMLHARARIRTDLGDADSAKEDYESALRLYQDILKDGALTGELSDYANDAQLTETERDRRTAAVGWIVRTWTALADLCLESGDSLQAEELLRRALEACLSDEYIGRKNLLTSRVCQSLALACQARGKPAEALDQIDLAMRIQWNLFNFSETYPGLTEVYQAYGRILMENGRAEEARERFRDALRLAQEAYGENHALTAKAWYWTGIYESAAGDPAAAPGAFARAVEIRRNILGYAHTETVRCLYRLSLAAAEAGDAAQADEAAREARRLCELLGLKGELADRVNAL